MNVSHKDISSSDDIPDPRTFMAETDVAYCGK